MDIAAPFRALLPVLAFEGATKRNRPQLQVRPRSRRPRVLRHGLGTAAGCALAHASTAAQHDDE